ncbi:MAG: helix-hairpin-helix domain-containing protein, partial [Paludibacteraceae bacterium]|nr:helix-hairpin-helix domain-containing protein [Paludibacteraceae bacterium]
QEIAEANETSKQRHSQWVRDTSNSDSNYLRSSKEPHFNKLDYKKESKKTAYTSGHFNDATKQNFRQDRYAGLQVDINTADTAELRKLPGIGEKRAINIVKYRSSLGGFYTVEQLAEVYSIDAELVERLKKYIVCDGNSVAKIDINNTIPYKLWHPYLKGELLKTIKQRIKNGKRYKSFDEIKAENGYDEKLNGRAEMYLEFK